MVMVTRPEGSPVEVFRMMPGGTQFNQSERRDNDPRLRNRTSN
jgi:hypothetical protein